MNIPPAVYDSIAGSLCATGGVFDPDDTYLGLYISGPSTVPPETVTDFTLPNATDCPAQKITSWDTVTHLNDGRSCMQAPPKRFQLPDDTHAFTAGGYYLADALTGGNVLAYQAFDTPIGMPDEFHSVTIAVRLAPPVDVDWDANVVFNG